MRCRSYLTASIISLLALAAGALTFPAARAQAASHEEVLQRKGLVARADLNRWHSRKVAGTVFIHVFNSHGEELTAHYVSPCRESFWGSGMVTWVRFEGCRAKAVDYDRRQPVVFRYLSVAGPRRFTVVISR